MKHVTVLKTEAVDALDLSPDSVVVDATFGSGGHAAAILSILKRKGVYIGIDADARAFEGIREEIESHKANTHLLVDDFRNIASILDWISIESVDAILADLGWRSEQFTKGERGFSFHDDSPLLMTYGEPEHYPFTAYDIVNAWDEENIADVIYGYGEERASRRIARAIISARTQRPIKTAAELAAVIEGAIPRKGKRIHPATKTFQALRIAVNDELGALAALIEDGFARLRPGGRMAIITFHSIEDRVVKRLFKTFIHDHAANAVTKKPITPTRDEITANPRARSAKLRVIEKT